MEFRTQIPINTQSKTIELGQQFVTIGSCFANSIDQKLIEHKFQTENNPLGIIYDPISIARVLNYAITGNRPDAQSYFNLDSTFINLMAHSDMNGANLEETKGLINTQLEKLYTSLKNANWLIITLGTSWVYTHKNTGIQVANCHKIPQKEFDKSLLPFDRTKTIFNNLLQLLEEFNPNLNIILTVSPVRHTKDTLPLNTLSKSHLFLLSHYLEQSHKNVTYYPAYELLIDDLRDYRFYKSDMIHPSEQAVDYIWEHFLQTYFNSETQTFFKEWQLILKALNHKPFNSKSTQHQSFIKATIQKLELLKGKIDTNQEIDVLKKQLLA